MNKKIKKSRKTKKSFVNQKLTKKILKSNHKNTKKKRNIILKRNKTNRYIKQNGGNNGSGNGRNNGSGNGRYNGGGNGGKRNSEKKGGQKNEPSNHEYNIRLNANQSNDNTRISYTDKSYDNNLFVRESHNCYTYFLNLKSESALDLCKRDFKKHNMCRRAQPGYLSGHPTLQKTDYKCPIISKRTMDDNPEIYKLDSVHDTCKPDFYKGALVVAPGRDYHYYRQDDDNNGLWSHKPGYKPTTIRDAKNNIIVDPKIANRNYGDTLNYKDFCGYYCIPRSGKRKSMAHKGEEIDKKSHNKYRITLNKHQNGTNKNVNALHPPSQFNKLKTLGKKVVNMVSNT